MDGKAYSGEPITGKSRKRTGSPVWDEDRIRAADAREANGRWAAKSKARVTHPMWGSVIVPCSSPLAAVHCAAEVWGVDWLQVINAKVEACDQSLPTEPRPVKEADKPEKNSDKSWMVIHPALGYVYVTAADVTAAIWAAAKHWGKDPRLAEFHQGCTVRARR